MSLPGSQLANWLKSVNTKYLFAVFLLSSPIQSEMGRRRNV